MQNVNGETNCEKDDLSRGGGKTLALREIVHAVRTQTKKRNRPCCTRLCERSDSRLHGREESACCCGTTMMHCKETKASFCKCTYKGTIIVV